MFVLITLEVIWSSLFLSYHLYLLLLLLLRTATTLTSWHLLVTFCSLHVALWMKMFEHKPFDPRAVMGFGILNGISIGLLNLSLGFNSVGFYQVIIAFSFQLLHNGILVACFLLNPSSLLLILDDKASNHPLYCSLGDPLLQEKVQVSTQGSLYYFLYLSVLWRILSMF